MATPDHDDAASQEPAGPDTPIEPLISFAQWSQAHPKHISAAVQAWMLQHDKNSWGHYSHAQWDEYLKLTLQHPVRD